MKNQEKTFKEKIIGTVLQPFFWLKKFVCTVGAAVVALLIALSLFAGNFYYQLPDIKNMDYEEIKEIAVERTKKRLSDPANYFRWSEIEDVNRDYLYTIVMAEDANFFKHGGINYDALVDAIARNYKDGGYGYGASTITQQVAKNLFLTSSKSFYRKAQEYFIAKDLERRFSKNQILELYFNIAEFGPDVYGVRAAAFRVFDKPPAKINAAEGAFISLLLPSPKRYYYAMMQNHSISAKNHRKLTRILKDMRYHEFITYKQYLEYRKYPYFKKK